MLVSDNEERIQKARFWATQSRDKARHYQHSELGFNYRMSNVSAGIGRGQLKVLDERVAKKRYIFEYYKRELEHLEGIQFMPVNEWDEPNFWLSCLTLNGRVKPIEIIEVLVKENIVFLPVWQPILKLPSIYFYNYVLCIDAEDIFVYYL